MKHEQKALIVKDAPETTHGLDELNLHLRRGWRVRHAVPMGAAGLSQQGAECAPCFAALIVIERDDRGEADMLLEAEEEMEGLIEEIMEGDGANADIEEPLE